VVGVDGTAGVASDGGDACAADGDGGLPGAPGFGTGFTKSACHVYSTRKARKMARRTRRSI
jgi:hypothetical protein